MKILSVDTSTSIAGIAVIDGGCILLELNINNINKTHSKRLIPLIKSMLEEVKLQISDFDGFAVVTGPGSFTGLRIGITTAKSFSYVTKKPIIGVKTLDVLAYNFPIGDFLVCPIINARNRQVYTALYINEHNIQKRISDYEAIHIDELVQKLLEQQKKVIFVGDGIDENQQFLKEELRDRCIIAPENLKMQKASTLAVIANYKFVEGQIDECFDIKPFYMRKSQAERIKEMKKKV